MWYIIFITALPCVFGAATRPVKPLEGPLWNQRLTDSLASSEDITNLSSDLFKQLYQQYQDERNNGPEEEALPRPAGEKRALAMFARWGSINSIGKNRTPIRSQYFFDPQETISAQTRSRMLGQPLRWG
ncbi:hypothetical protein NQ315_016855 [Exocentrus adspersus]|uniref:Uncharacterized protein n=1 Tax=Exocentrus adspersus TaxID=1586481 RepID=A0AAV8VXG0_9CUCU|nr:hypothetical protein NQ315_016855 [Exocentrus adspersus]